MRMMTMQANMGFVGEHVHIASEDEISAGLNAANKVFSSHNVDPADCAAANEKLGRDELLTREEARLCVIWGEADDMAFRALTLGWLARDVDIRLGLQDR